MSDVTADPVLAVEGLTKRFGHVAAVDDVSFAVDRGERLAVLGPNGAGKSTLLRMVATLSRPTEGRIALHGTALQGSPSLRRHLGVVSHDTMLYDDLTARENLRLHARIHGVADRETRCNELLEQVGLRRRASERPDRFSHGLRKRLALARALVHDPDVLLLDEPYAGLDRRSAARFGEVLQAVTDRTVLLTTHDLATAADHCTRALFVAGGQRQGTADLTDVTDPASLERRYETAVYGGEPDA